MSSKQNKCTGNPGKFKRLLPYHGMMLTADDFKAEQTYFREKLKLHNRLHGYGVVCGLHIDKVVIEIPQSCEHKITVHPGMAIDWNGNEIIVCKDHVVDLSDKCRQLFSTLCAECPDGKEPTGQQLPKILYIGIRYAETATDPQTIYTADCDCDQKRCEYSRVQEGFCISVFLPNELPWQSVDRYKDLKNPFACQSLSADCVLREEREHYVTIGSVTFTDQLNYDVTSHRQYVPETPRSYYHWRTPENYLISHEQIGRLCAEAGWYNLSSLIGLSDAEAQQKLTEYKLNYQSSHRLNQEILYYIFKRTDDNLPFATQNDLVYLILDDNGKVLLPIINPQQEYLKKAGIKPGEPAEKLTATKATPPKAKKSTAKSKKG